MNVIEPVAADLLAAAGEMGGVELADAHQDIPQVVGAIADLERLIGLGRRHVEDRFRHLPPSSNP